MKYIALLRGINIGRSKRIKMADLVKTLDSLGFKNIKTYLQSGNVIFEYDSSDISEIEGSIERKISETFSFSVDVIIRTKDELESTVKDNPFISEHDIELDKLHVTFLSDIPDQKAILNMDINKAENEKFEIIGREVYLYCPNAMFEKKLNTTATTRNWKTTNKLLELSS